jgi:hypothetical protein
MATARHTPHLLVMLGCISMGACDFSRSESSEKLRPAAATASNRGVGHQTNAEVHSITSGEHAGQFFVRVQGTLGHGVDFRSRSMIRVVRRLGDRPTRESIVTETVDGPFYDMSFIAGPGDYVLVSDPLDKAVWRSYGSTFELRNDGTASIREIPFFYLSRIEITSPQFNETIDVDDVVFGWRMIPDAASYKIWWSKGAQVNRDDTQTLVVDHPEVMEIRPTVDPDSCYRWTIYAYDKDGEAIAFNEGRFCTQ